MNPKMLTRLIIPLCFVFFMGCEILDQDDDYINGMMQANVNGELIIFDEAYGDRIFQEDMTWSGIQKIVGRTDLDVSGYEIHIHESNKKTGIIDHPFCMHKKWKGTIMITTLSLFILPKI